MPKRALAAALAASFVFLIGAPPAQASPVGVKIVNFAFRPASVSISMGTKVVWKNATISTTHTVTSYKGRWTKNTVVGAGSTTSFTFNSTGMFSYYCSIHAHITPSGTCVANAGIPTRMCGSVVVT